MSKAIFVMDMPNSCDECPLFNTKREGVLCNGALNKTNNWSSPSNKRQDWCPLKRIPKKDDENYYPDEYMDGYADGWNAFIDRLIE